MEELASSINLIREGGIVSSFIAAFHLNHENLIEY